MEYKERVESDDEYDDFGRRKKKKGGGGDGRGAVPTVPNKYEAEEEYEEDEEEEEDDDDDGDVSKYDLWGNDDDDNSKDKNESKEVKVPPKAKAREKSRSRSKDVRKKSRRSRRYLYCIVFSERFAFLARNFYSAPAQVAAAAHLCPAAAVAARENMGTRRSLAGPPGQDRSQDPPRRSPEDARALPAVDLGLAEGPGIV